GSVPVTLPGMLSTAGHRASVVLGINEMNRNAGLRLTSLEHRLEHTIPVHPTPTESRQERRMSVENSPRNVPSTKGPSFFPSAHLEPPRQTRPDPGVFSMTNERPERRLRELGPTRQSRHCCSRPPTPAAVCAHRRRHRADFEA